jgi:hypothetical protein
MQQYDSSKRSSRLSCMNSDSRLDNLFAFIPMAIALHATKLNLEKSAKVRLRRESFKDFASGSFSQFLFIGNELQLR